MKLDELAKLAGVSRTTASYVVNGKAKQYRVSDKTIAKVNALIKEHNFKPDALAASLRAGKTNTIGLIIPDFENISYAQIANLLENRCREKGYQLLIGCTNDNAQNEIACVQQLLRRKVDALIVSSALASDDPFYQQQADKVSIIGFDRKIMVDKVQNVLSNDEQDAFRLAENLLQNNYNNVLFLGAVPELATSCEREKGFRQALKARSISAQFLYAEQFHKQSAAQIMQQWLEHNPLPEAIFVTSLTLLRGVFQALLAKYKAIPKQLAIATFGNHEMLDLLENKVICSVQHHEKIVESLLQLTFSQLDNQPINQPIQPIERDIQCRNCG
ncbi:catabolite repressor/activator [Pasteurellaceae bacterium 22721_9_1]